MTADPPVGVVLLAAGRGTRFAAGPKLVAPLDGRPLVRHAAESALATRLRPVVAVVGHAGEAVRAALDGLDLAVVANPDYAAGLATSLRTGLAALPLEVVGAVILLGDMPRVAPALLDALAAAFRPGADAAVVPVSGGRRGNPVLLNRHRLAAELATLVGDHGAGPLLRGRDDVRELPVADVGVLADVDTVEALAGLAGS
jgi:molybdenum cofactor cytidylyltransferase